MGGRKWVVAEDDFLRTNYPTHSRRWLAEQLDRPFVGVERRLVKLGIRKQEPLSRGPNHKFCSRCKTTKSRSEFYAHRGSPDGLQGRCKQCSVEMAVDWNKKNVDRFHFNTRTHVLRKKYGLERDQVEAILARQGGACAICGEVPRRFCVDHDHETGRVRGLLCFSCNVSLGGFQDSRTRLRRAVRYLTAK